MGRTPNVDLKSELDRAKVLLAEHARRYADLRESMTAILETALKTQAARYEAEIATLKARLAHGKRPQRERSAGLLQSPPPAASP